MPQCNREHFQFIPMASAAHSSGAHINLRWTILKIFLTFSVCIFVFFLISNSFATVCQQMESGVQAIFGPSDQLLGSHIQSICEALALPHIETRIDFETQPKKFSINLHPSQQHINNAYKDLMVYLNWTKVAIIYEEDYGLCSTYGNRSCVRGWMLVCACVPSCYQIFSTSSIFLSSRVSGVFTSTQRKKKLND